jgi:glycosyltransferase involved in cell wall biosynthesis
MKGIRQPHQVLFFNTQVPAALIGRSALHRPYVLCTDITPVQYDQMGDHYGHQPDRSGWLSRYKHQTNVKIFHGATRILPWSGWVQASLVYDYGVPRNRIEVIPPGVDVDFWQPGTKEQGDKVRVLFVGGDFYRKGGEDLLAAFRPLADKVELILVTRSSVPTQEGVTVYQDMRPNSPELVALCQSCDLFVLPTRAEAFGIAAVEASAVGLPVIGTAVGGLGDIVVDGETGFLLPPGDVQTLTQRLQQLVEQKTLRQQMGQAARKRVEQGFDARKNAARIAHILQELVGNTLT